jgi:hypothetical protein
MNFRQLDLNLLRVLATLYRTRSITATGKVLSRSQAATSNALARLRHKELLDLLRHIDGGFRAGFTARSPSISPLHPPKCQR